MPSAVVDSWNAWRSSDYPINQQYDAWNAALNDSHLKWSLQDASKPSFNAAIQMRTIGNIRLLHCDCDCCHGKRTKSEISQDNDEYYGALLIYDGSETVNCNGTTVNLGKSDFFIWDSSKPIEFLTGPNLKKVTMLVPQSLFQQRYPQISDSIGRTIPMHGGMGAVTASHIVAMGQQTNNIEHSNAVSLVDLTLDMIATCLEARAERPTSKARSGLLRDIKRFILDNLDETAMDPPYIAEHFNISLRYLYMVFQDSGTSVYNFILSERLERCRRELSHSNWSGETITDLALRWCFNDSSQFCKAFHRAYGVSPREYKKSLLE